MHKVWGSYSHAFGGSSQVGWLKANTVRVGKRCIAYNRVLCGWESLGKFPLKCSFLRANLGLVMAEGCLKESIVPGLISNARLMGLSCTIAYSKTSSFLPAAGTLKADAQLSISFWCTLDHMLSP